MAIKSEEKNWKRKIQVTVSPAAAELSVTLYCQDVMVAAVCKTMNDIRPEKIKVRRWNLSMMYDPARVNTK